MTSLRTNIFRVALSFGLVAVLCLQTSCSSYRLGSPAPIKFKSLYIKPVANRSFAPQAQTIVSAQLRETLIRDARIKIVAGEENADAVLDITLTNYERQAAARSSVDTAVANNFDVNLTATVSLFNRSTREYIFENRPIETRTDIYLNNPYIDDQPIAFQLGERQAMEQLARQLARKIADEVLSPW